MLPEQMVYSERRMYAWDSKMAAWMYGSVQDPELVFHQLKPEDKDVLRLVQLMLTESVDKVKEINQASEAKHQVELKRMYVQLTDISDKQRDLKMAHLINMCFLSFSMTSIYTVCNNMKSQSLQVIENVASNSEEIVSDLVEAVKYGVDQPRLLGEGKPFVWKDKWLQKKGTGAVTHDAHKK